MSKRYLPALIVLFLLVTAAAGFIITIGADGRTPITRLNFDPLQHLVRIYGDVVPPVPHHYPDVVARVNGDAITGDDLMEREVQLVQERLSYAEVMSQAGAPKDDVAPLLAQFDEVDPLELLIERVLLRQAVEREGTRGSLAEVQEFLRDQEEVFILSKETMESEEHIEFTYMLRLLGYPEDNWAADEKLIDHFRGRYGLTTLGRQECEDGPVALAERDAVRLGRDCSAFLAAERAAADIEVYVRWVD